MSTQFTPGPWKLADGHYPGMHEIQGPSLRLSFWTVATDIDLQQAEQRMRDAHLIAAAPDLYEALVNLLENPAYETAIGGNPNAVTAMLVDAKAALAKARGET